MTITPDTAVDLEIVADLRRREFLGILAAAGLLAGCGGSGSAGRAPSPGFPRTITHPGGELTLSERPRRVVAAGPYSELDVLLALGVMPAGYGEVPVDPLRPWQRTAGAGDVDTFSAASGPDIESLLGVRPDLMVMNGTTYAGYPEWVEEYSQVCPVLAMPAGIEEQLTLVAEALGLDPERVSAATEGVADVLAAFAPAYRPSSIVIAEYFGDGQLFTWTPKSPHAALLRRLGLPDLSSPEAPADDPDAQIVPVSMERIDLLEADALWIPDNGSGALDELEGDPLFVALDVVGAGRYTRLDAEASFAIGDVTALSLPTAVAAIERALA